MLTISVRSLGGMPCHREPSRLLRNNIKSPRLRNNIKSPRLRNNIKRSVGGLPSEPDQVGAPDLSKTGLFQKLCGTDASYGPQRDVGAAEVGFLERPGQ